MLKHKGIEIKNVNASTLIKCQKKKPYYKEKYSYNHNTASIKSLNKAAPPSADRREDDEELRLSLAPDLGVQSLSLEDLGVSFFIACPLGVSLLFCPVPLGVLSRLVGGSFLADTRLEVGVGLLRGVSWRDPGRLLDLPALLLLLPGALGVSEKYQCS